VEAERHKRLRICRLRQILKYPGNLPKNNNRPYSYMNATLKNHLKSICAL